MLYTVFIETPIGYIGLTEENGYLIRSFCVQAIPENIQPTMTPLLNEAMNQIQEYFVGNRHQFELPLNAAGTDFQKQVWQELLTISYGEVKTYGEIAKQIGNPRAVRAVGQANHNNPLMIFVPCHRVIGANGALTGYAGGLDKKRFLLQLEGSLIV